MMDRSLSNLLRRAQSCLGAEFAAADPGVTLQQLIVLRALAQNGPQSQRAIVEITGIDRSTLNVMLRTMADGGMIEPLRRIAPGHGDARITMVEITPTGIRKLKAAQRAEKNAESKTLRALGKFDREKLIQNLSVIVATPRSADV